jgi:hypothetical protein
MNQVERTSGASAARLACHASSAASISVTAVMTPWIAAEAAGTRVPPTVTRES